MSYNDSRLLVAQLHDDLLEARRSGDQLTASALQGVIAAIDNAGAVPVIRTLPTGSVGVGSTEAPRQELSVQALQSIIKNEITELQQATLHFSAENAYFDEMTMRIKVLKKYLG